jgi:hypothetical protein
MPMQIDPFTVPADEKAARLLRVNEAALQAGADYCSSTLHLARERNFLQAAGEATSRRHGCDAIHSSRSPP